MSRPAAPAARQRNGLVQRTGRLTRKEAEALGEGAQPLMNLGTRVPGVYDVLQRHLLRRDDFSLHGAEACTHLGAPLVRMPAYESTPGLWVFDDTASGIVFLLWSDGYKKHPWKGTSYETRAVPEQLEQLPAAIERLFEYVRQGPEPL